MGRSKGALASLLGELENSATYDFEALYLKMLVEINTALEREKISRTELAERLGIDRSSVTRLLAGEQANPTLKTLARYAHALDSRVEMRIVPKDEDVRLCSKPDSFCCYYGGEEEWQDSTDAIQKNDKLKHSKDMAKRAVSIGESNITYVDFVTQNNRVNYAAL